MADVPIHPLGVEAVPADAVVPLGADWQPKAVFAHFDGSAAGAAWLPVLQILDTSGSVVAEIPMDSSVAAGASVEATWAPFLRAASAAAAASVAGGWAWMSGTNGAFASTGFSSNTVDLAAGSFATTDAATFATGVSGGFHGVNILKAGSYLLSVTVNGNTGVAPPAGAFIQTANSSALSNVILDAFEGLWINDGAGSYSAFASQQTIIEVKSPSAPAPQLILMDAGQNTGAAIFLSYFMGVVALSTVTP